MRCAKSQKLYNMATVPLQICNGTDRCCKIFIILYSHFCLLSFHFFFSLLSHSPVPSLFSLCWFPPFSTSSGCSPSTTTAQLRQRQRTPPRSISLQPLNLTPATRSHPRSATLDPADLTPRPPLISRSATLQPLYLSLVVGFFFFFFTAIWVDLMVVLSCGLWTVTVAVVVVLGDWYLLVFFFFFFFPVLLVVSALLGV